MYNSISMDMVEGPVSKVGIKFIVNFYKVETIWGGEDRGPDGIISGVRQKLRSSSSKYFK